MSTPSRQRQVLGLLGWLAVSFAASAVGAVASVRASSFYNLLVQPDWAPPASVFGPVWTVLYALMGIAAWLVWRVGGFQGNRPALTWFLAQLVVNALWSWLFFAWHLGAIAFANILLLALLVVGTLVSFWRVQRLAGALLVPYLLWVSFAAALNYSVWQLNPRVLGQGMIVLERLAPPSTPIISCGPTLFSWQTYSNVSWFGFQRLTCAPPGAAGDGLHLV